MLETTTVGIAWKSQGVCFFHDFYSIPNPEGKPVVVVVVEVVVVVVVVVVVAVVVVIVVVVVVCR